MHSILVALLLISLSVVNISCQSSYVWQVFNDLPNSPPATAGSSMTYVGSRTFLDFGGHIEPDSFVFSNELYSLYVFNAPYTTPTWTLIQPVDGVKPPARAYHQAIYDFINIRYIIFGGVIFGGPGVTLFDDMWSYSLLDNQWTQLDDVEVGVGLAGAAAGTYGRYIEVFGGVIEFDSNFREVPTNATWRYDLLFNKWLQLFPDPSPPARILSQDFETWNCLYVNGGRVNDTVFNDTWRWWSDLQQWSDITQEVNDITPGRLQGVSMAVSSLFAFVFGGQVNDEIDCGNFTLPRFLRDLWLFNPANNNWNEVTATGDMPLDVSRAAAACDYIYGDCYFIAGVNRNCSGIEFNNNLYRFTTILADPIKGDD